MIKNTTRGDFDVWWDTEELHTEENPFRKGSPAYWAWAGWVASKEREPLNDLEMGEIINSEVTIKDPALYDAVCNIIRKAEKLHDIGVEAHEEEVPDEEEDNDAA